MGSNQTKKPSSKNSGNQRSAFIKRTVVLLIAGFCAVGTSTMPFSVNAQNEFEDEDEDRESRFLIRATEVLLLVHRVGAFKNPNRSAQEKYSRACWSDQIYFSAENGLVAVDPENLFQTLFQLFDVQAAKHKFEEMFKSIICKEEMREYGDDLLSKYEKIYRTRSPENLLKNYDRACMSYASLVEHDINPMDPRWQSSLASIETAVKKIEEVFKEVNSSNKCKEVHNEGAVDVR